jgi:hypothetical protein
MDPIRDAGSTDAETQVAGFETKKRGHEGDALRDEAAALCKKLRTLEGRLEKNREK